MRYWLYSDGNILGPYTPAELSEVPDFSEESLVCEAKQGEVSDNWKPASQIKELAKYLYPEASEAAEPERKEDPVSKIFEDFRVSSHENGEKAPEAASAGTADVEASSRKASAQANAEEAVQPEQAQIIEEIPVQPSSGRQEPDDEFEKLFKKETENRKRKEVKKSIADILNEPDGGILAREKKNGGEDEKFELPDFGDFISAGENYPETSSKSAVPYSDYGDFKNLKQFNSLKEALIKDDTSAEKASSVKEKESFEIRLLRVKEELESAKWEKQLLLGKLRLKEIDEKKSRERISELENSLEEQKKSAELSEIELAKSRNLGNLRNHLNELKEIERMVDFELTPASDKSGPVNFSDRAVEPERDIKTAALTGPADVRTVENLTETAEPSVQLPLPAAEPAVSQTPAKTVIYGEGEKTEPAAVAGSVEAVGGKPEERAEVSLYGRRRQTESASAAVQNRVILREEKTTLPAVPAAPENGFANLKAGSEKQAETGPAEAIPDEGKTEVIIPVPPSVSLPAEEENGKAEAAVPERREESPASDLSQSPDRLKREPVIVRPMGVEAGQTRRAQQVQINTTGHGLSGRTSRVFNPRVTQRLSTRRLAPINLQQKNQRGSIADQIAAIDNPEPQQGQQEVRKIDPLRRTQRKAPLSLKGSSSQVQSAEAKEGRRSLLMTRRQFIPHSVLEKIQQSGIAPTLGADITARTKMNLTASALNAAAPENKEGRKSKWGNNLQQPSSSKTVRQNIEAIENISKATEAAAAPESAVQDNKTAIGDLTKIPEAAVHDATKITDSAHAPATGQLSAEDLPSPNTTVSSVAAASSADLPQAPEGKKNKKKRSLAFAIAAAAVILGLGAFAALKLLGSSDSSADAQTASTAFDDKSAAVQEEPASAPQAAADQPQETPQQQAAAPVPETETENSEVSQQQYPNAAGPDFSSSFQSSDAADKEKAMDIVKSYKLAGGKGTVKRWFASSLQTEQGESSSWKATYLRENRYIVEYKVTRQRADPTVYDFAVDIQAGKIVETLTTAATNLIPEISGKKTEDNAVRKALTKDSPKLKAISKKNIKKSDAGKIKNTKTKTAPAVKDGKDNPGFSPLLPLPPEPEETSYNKKKNAGNQDSRISYLKAQESDEELF